MSIADAEIIKSCVNTIKNQMKYKEIDEDLILRNCLRNCDKIYECMYDICKNSGPYKSMSLDEFINTEVLL
jgi:hypothetical protein